MKTNTIQTVANCFLIFLLFAPFLLFSQNYQELDSLRNHYRLNQDYLESLNYADKAYSWVKENQPQNDTLLNLSLYNLSFAHRYAGEVTRSNVDTEHYNNSIHYGKMFIENAGNMTVPDNVKIGDIYYSIGFVFERLRNFSKAEEYYLLSSETFLISEGKYQDEHLYVLSRLGILYNTIGQHSKAEKYHLEVLQRREESDAVNSHNHILAVNNIAVHYYYAGNYSEAEAYFVKGLNLSREVMGVRDAEYLKALNNLAGLNYMLGNLEKAVQYFIEVADLRREILGPQNPDYALSLNNLAFVYEVMGEQSKENEQKIYYFQKAEPIYKECIDIRKNVLGVRHPSYSITLNNLASLYSNFGKILQDTILIIEKFKNSEELYKESLSLFKETIGENTDRYAKTNANLADLYVYWSLIAKSHSKSMEYLGNAEALFLESINILRELIGENHSDFAIPVSNIAFLYKIKSRVEEDLEMKNNWMKQSEQYYTHSTRLIIQNLYKQFSFLSETEKELYIKKHIPDFEKFYSFSIERYSSNNQISEEAYNTILKTKGILLKSITAMRNAILNSEDDEIIADFEKWTELKKRITALYAVDVEKREADPEELENQAYELEKMLVRKSSEFGDFDELISITWEDVKNKLQPNEAAIEFINFQHEVDRVLYCALIVKPNSKIPVMLSLFEEKELENLLDKIEVSDYERISATYGSKAETDTMLYNLIWQPMQDYLEGITTVNVSPSGLLHKVSFSSMGTGMNKFLLDEYQINLLTTTAYVNSGKKLDINETSTVALFGGINYSTITQENTPWTYLPGTLVEIESIFPVLKSAKTNVVIHSGKKATKDVFKNITPESDIVHVATHGFFFPDPDKARIEISPEVVVGEIDFRGVSRYAIESFISNKNPLMRSGLVFSGVNDYWRGDKAVDEDDGVLTALEVINIDLRKNRLMVLSACETGLGDIAGSEGVYGLQRAFKMAGTDFIIMSLWQVPDKETAEFMEMLYSLLINEKDLRLAFNKTQIEMRQKYDPFFWAAFVLVE